ncbi:response regulator [uncultured Gimesia sp.]|uniref:response regulator n=1 Tax=uncultured Gimesia sp. TaxID=1678688 RepID=UPI0030DB8B08|tara:strand:- start:156265 stop:159228 length:2964 start_codon:yes stop_codon:yes gene_type:complete
MQFLNLLEQQRDWSPCILYVDENISHFRKFEAINAGQGYEIHLSLNAKASLMLSLKIQPDIIILSLDLQDADPIEMIRFYKSQDALSNTAILATTQFQESEKIEGALEYGVDDFLLRPYNDSLVSKRIRNTLQIIAIQKSDRIQMALSNILEESLNEIYIFGAESNRIFYASRGATNNLGYPIQVLQSMSPFQFLQEDSASEFKAAIHDLLENPDSQAVLSAGFQRKDGTKYPVEIYLQKTVVFSRPAIVVLATDITKLVQQREQVERLARAVDSSAEAVFITDTRGVINYVNAAFSDLYGWSAEEAIGQTPRFIKSKLNPESIYREMWDQLLSGNTWQGTLINRRKATQRLSGSLPLLGQNTRQQRNWLDDYRWVHMTVSPIFDQRGECISYVALQRDITEKVLDEKKQSQRHLQAVIRAGVAKSLQQQSHLKIKLQQVLTGLLEVPEHKSLNRGCLYLNNEQTRQSELITQYGEFLTPPPAHYHGFSFAEDYAQFPITVRQMQIINQCHCDCSTKQERQENASHGHYLIPITHRKEQLGALVLFSDIFPDDDPDQMLFLNSLGELIGVAIANDRLTEELKSARQEAVEANISKDLFLANISHEIRTPMTAILGYSEILMEQLEPGSQVKMIDTIKQNGDYLLSLINDLLDLSKINSQKMTVELMCCSPAEILNNVENLLNVRAEKKQIQYMTEYDGAIPEYIQTDPTKLKQILVNLVGNAIKFTDEGSVRVITRYLDQGPSPCLEIKIVDTGVGITGDQMKELFQPFTQADASMARRFGGTGLGLTICKKLIELLNGSISVSSVSAEGSTFLLKVPVGHPDKVKLLQYDSGKQEQAENAADIPEITGNLKDHFGFSPRILVAEDAVDNQNLISFILEKWQCDLQMVENGELALEAALAAEEQGVPFDIVLMDIQMPVMDGYTATRKLREAGYTRPIIAITAHAMTSELQGCLAVGCDTYTSKPINRKQLLSLICQYTNREHAHTV